MDLSSAHAPTDSDEILGRHSEYLQIKRGRDHLYSSPIPWQRTSLFVMSRSWTAKEDFDHDGVLLHGSSFMKFTGDFIQLSQNFK